MPHGTNLNVECMLFLFLISYIIGGCTRPNYFILSTNYQEKRMLTSANLTVVNQNLQSV